MSATDEQLIDQIARGDQTSFARLYDRYAPRVLGLLVKLLPSRGEADDVLQEAFLQIWKTAGRYDPSRGRVVSWVFLIARSRATDLLRRRRPGGPEVQEDDIVTDDNPSDGLQRKEDRQQVRRCLADLSVEQREVIELAYYAGLTHVEIAQRLALPLGTVKTRIRLGMRRLRESLADDAEEESTAERITSGLGS